MWGCVRVNVNEYKEWRMGRKEGEAVCDKGKMKTQNTAIVVKW